MTGGTWPIALFCLTSGAALGALFLLCKALRLALGGGKLLTAALDTAFGLVCGAVVFLCALAVDKGRLRLLQAALQALGAWGVVVSLDPLATAGESFCAFCGRRFPAFSRLPSAGQREGWHAGKKRGKRKILLKAGAGARKKPAEKGQDLKKIRHTPKNRKKALEKLM